MESRVQQAIERHHKGYNCAQAVVCTYADLFGVDEDTAYRISESFGFGMGSQSVCGALTGALMLLGPQSSAGASAPGQTKRQTYGIAREATEEFAQVAGSTVCREIKTTPIKLSCDGCVEAAVRMVEAHLATLHE